MKRSILLTMVLCAAGASFANAGSASRAQPAVEGEACHSVGGKVLAKDGTSMLTCVDLENVWKLASDPTANHPCRKNGRTTNPDGTTVQCRIEDGKVVPVK